MIRLAIIDDHTLFRSGMKALFDDVPEMEVVLEAGDGQAFLEGLESRLLDLVLMDVEMPGMDGLEATKQARKRFPDLKVIMLSTHDDDGLIIAAMENGASGYLLKTAEEEEVIMAIQAVMEKGFYVNERVSASLLRKLTQNNTIQPVFAQSVPLNEKEIKVLKLICQEYTTAEIADKMHLGTRTIDGYRASLLEKTGARNTAGLVVYAVKQGIF